ncbi:YIP1 family protein [Paracoccus caeni]|uniref:YIP1 family protein n=1 Tax=Paracoccus caeni TaxID=657651 RepID=A0A934SGW3_9RHOB|nr:YIP1 family protein [Paracoccus caeni]MBK4217225.1 YIP1 family protein [Paracoccus caeni]
MISLTSLRGLVVDSFRRPADVAGVLIRSDIPMPARWMLLILVISFSGILSYLTSLTVGPGPSQFDDALLEMIGQPMVMAGIQLVAVLAGSALVISIGRLFGGTGRFEDALLLMVWTEFLLLLVQGLQLLLVPILPTAAAVLGLAAAFVFLWMSLQFVRVLHGFDNLIKPVVVVIGAGIGAVLILSVVLSMAGFTPEVPNDL